MSQLTFIQLSLVVTNAQWVVLCTVRVTTVFSLDEKVSNIIRQTDNSTIRQFALNLYALLYSAQRWCLLVRDDIL